MTDSARLLTSKEVSAAVKADLAERIAALTGRGVTPTLHLIRVGSRDDDVHYEASVVRAGEKIGLRVTRDELPQDVTQEDLEAALARANEDDAVHGIMVFQPLPEHLDVRRVNAMIDPVKDVDGLSPANQALVYAGDKKGVAPATPAACMAFLKHYEVPLKGARVVVVGRSLVVGKPMAMLLLDEHATVTVCHSRTQDLPERTKEADVVVAAIGRRKMLGAEYFRPGQTVIDVGIHEDEDGSLVGDVDLAAVAPVVDAITPAKGGVGAVTTTLLLEHVVTAAERLTSTEEK